MDSSSLCLVGGVAIGGGGLALAYLFRGGGMGQRMAEGLAIQNGPVKGQWRGLLLPVEPAELFDMSNFPGAPQLPANTHMAMFTVEGSRLAVTAQWFQNNWTRAGLLLPHAPQSGGERHYFFQDAHDEGIVEVAFKLEVSPYVHTVVLIHDQRGATRQA